MQCLYSFGVSTEELVKYVAESAIRVGTILKKVYLVAICKQVLVFWHQYETSSPCILSGGSLTLVGCWLIHIKLWSSKYILPFQGLLTSSLLNLFLRIENFARSPLLMISVDSVLLNSLIIFSFTSIIFTLYTSNSVPYLFRCFWGRSAFFYLSAYPFFASLSPAHLFGGITRAMDSMHL